MRYDYIYKEIVPFGIVRVIGIFVLIIGLVFLALWLWQAGGNPIGGGVLPDIYYTVMALFMVAVGVFLLAFRNLKISIYSDELLASLGFIKHSVSLSNITDVSNDTDTSLKYGGWGVRLKRYKEGWVLAYTTIGYKRVVLKLKEGKYKRFVFSTAHPEEITSILKNQLRR